MLNQDNLSVIYKILINKKLKNYLKKIKIRFKIKYNKLLKKLQFKILNF